MIAMAPILILLIIIGLIFLLTKRRMGAREKARYGKRTQRMLGGYVLILIISVGLFFLIPKPDSDFINGEQIAQQNTPDLYAVVYEDMSLDVIKKYKKNQWEFEYETDQLHIGYQGDLSSEVLIRVERKEENDGIIEAVYYQTPTVIEGIDMSEYITPIHIDMTSQRLNINMPEEVELNFTTYKREFPISQFTGGNWWMSASINETIAFGTNLINLRVPQEMKINADEYLNIHYVGE